MPDVPRGVCFIIDVLGILHVDEVEGLGQGFRGLRHDNGMDMIRHQAIGPDIEAVFPGIPAEPLPVLGVIIFFDENDTPVIPPLGDMVGITNGNSPGLPRHDFISWEIGELSPYFLIFS